MQTQKTVPNNAVAILVVSCDAYRDLWEPFFQCFFKYWPDCPYPIYLGANSATYPDVRVNALIIGPDVDYASNLIAMLQRIEEPWVILWIEDRVLAAAVETTRITRLVAAAQERKAGFVKLIASHPFAIPDDPSQEIGEIPKGTRYRVCMTVGLWNKQVLLRLLRPGETAWQIERQGSKRSNDFTEGFWSLSAGIRHDPPFSDVHLVVKGRLVRDARSFLAREWLSDLLKKRKPQTLGSFLYVRAYLVVKDMTTTLRWKTRRSRPEKMMRSVARVLMLILLVIALLPGAQRLVAAGAHNLGALTVSRIGVSIVNACSATQDAMNPQIQLAENHLTFSRKTSERYSLPGGRILSALYLMVGQPQAAESWAREVLAEAPSDPLGYFRLGQALLTQRRQMEALAAWQSAHAASYFVQKAFQHHWAGDDPAALDAYRIAVTVDPQAVPTDLRVAMAWAYYRQGDTATAEAEFQRAIDQASANAVTKDQAYAWGEKGIYYMRTGQPDRAVTSLSMSLIFMPDSTHYRLWLGGAYRVLNQFDLALAELVPLQATTTGETLGYVWWNLGAIYLAQSRYQLAAEALEVAVKILPHDQEVLALYASLQRLRSDGQK